MREPKTSLRLDIRLDAENPRHRKLRDKFNREVLRHGELGRIVVELFERNFDLDEDIRSQVLEFLYQGTPSILYREKPRVEATPRTHQGTGSPEEPSPVPTNIPERANVQAAERSGAVGNGTTHAEPPPPPIAPTPAPHRSRLSGLARGG